MARKQYTIEILQGCGDWMGSDKRYYATPAIAEAKDITARHFTAVRILRDGAVIMHSLPAFPEVAYPGTWGVRAREILAPFMVAETVTHLDPFMRLVPAEPEV